MGSRKHLASLEGQGIGGLARIRIDMNDISRAEASSTQQATVEQYSGGSSLLERFWTVVSAPQSETLPPLHPVAGMVSR